MSTLHCALENRVDLYVNERQKIQHYRARSTEKRRRRSAIFYLAWCVCKLRYFIHSFDWKSAIEHNGGV